jgi:hypothetical protein
VKLAAAHGALARSSVRVRSPWPVLISSVLVPWAGVASGLGGTPTSVRFVFPEVSGW